MYSMLKKLLCKIGWHSWTYEYISTNGVNIHARCQWCGYEGIIDSQGNLF
jgi:hypothetical protein